jgi:hypothetical protein
MPRMVEGVSYSGGREQFRLSLSRSCTGPSHSSQILVHFSRLDKTTLPLATGEYEDMSLM